MLNNGTQAVVLEPPPKPKTSRNIYLMLVLGCLWGFSDSIWTGTIIVSWVQLLAGGEDAKHSNSKVGYVEATQGLAMLLTALPIGYVADKYSRQVVIRAGSIGFFIATLLTLGAVLNPYLWSTDKQYLLILISMAFWGIGQGIFNGPSQALFADSIPKGERTKWYSRLMLCYLIPSIAGPIAAIVLLSMYGDHWSFEELRPVFVFGVVAELPPAVLSFFMRDDLALNNGGDGEDGEDGGKREDGEDGEDD
jgi:MFS family permease